MQSNRLFGNEKKYVNQVLDFEFRSSKGAYMMQKLESAFAKKFESEYAISAINGTATLHAIIEAAGIGRGDEVIVPPLTMSSTTFAVLQANATPVYADVDLETFLIDPASIESRITDKTKAIMTVSLYGLSPDMDEIMRIAKKYDLLVIEDNAQCFLGRDKGRIVGTVGHVASYSFQSSKHITAGEGGMIITDDKELAKKIRAVVSLGYAGLDEGKAKITKDDIQSPDYSRHVQMGWNYRMPELCAAVALAQLENIDELVQRRIEVSKMFEEAVQGCDWVKSQKVPEGFESSYWTFVLKLEHDSITWDTFRNKFMELGGHGVYGAWKLSYLEPMFESMSFLKREDFISAENKKQYKPGLCPNAEYLQKRLLQFKTNYWNLKDAHEQVEILKKAIAFFTNK